jgi:tRNA (cytidine56-2'-O)-methyltransferase
MIEILKLDHRPFRDKRITTHCALVARAFGANNFYYSGIEDNEFENNIFQINKQWGQISFKTKYILKPIEFVEKYKGIKIHLTMYGEQITKKIKEIENLKIKNNILIIIGGPKVEKFFYNNSTYNISVTNQPHSEVAALTLILYFLNPEYLDMISFKDTKIKINPSGDRKKVISL